MMTTAEGPRAESRAKQIRLIKEVAARLLAEKGVAGLSLREVSREMGVVSSAIYRYFATRDELLTALVYDAYNDLGARVEGSEARVAREDIRGRWRVTCNAVRRWSRAHPNEYALLYGTPVPGYRAPDVTIVAATRVVAVMGHILSDAYEAMSAESPEPPSRGVASFIEVPALRAVMPNVPAHLFVRALMAWTQVFGFVSFELFGHYVGSVRDANKMYAEVVEELAELLGIWVTPEAT